MLQHGAYNQLMDCCYDREEFPTLEEAIDWVWASSKEEVEAVEFVLKKFFDLREDGRYVQPRIEEELQNYLGKCLANQINGQKGGRPKKKTQSVSEKTQSVSKKTQVGPNKKAKPITNNHKPITNNQEDLKTLGHSQKNQDLLFDEFWTQYPRKQGKLAAEKSFAKLKPDRELTDRIIANIGRRLGAGDWSEKQFIPHASTYLNGARWEDEIISKQPQTKHEKNIHTALEWLGESS